MTVKRPRRLRLAGVVKVGGSLFDLDDWPTRLLAWLSDTVRKTLSPPLEPAVGINPLASAERAVSGLPSRGWPSDSTIDGGAVQRWLLVAGGGPWIDTLRLWDARQALGDEACHAWCVQLLTITADVARQRLLSAAQASSTIAVYPKVASRADLGAFLRWRTGLGSETPGAAPAALLGVIDAGEYLEHATRRGRRRLPRDWTVSSDSLAVCLAQRTRAGTLVLAKSCPLPSPATTLAEAVQAGLVDQHFPQAAADWPNRQWLDLRAVCPVAVPFLHAATPT